MEIIRRYLRCTCEYVMGFVDKEAVQRVNLLMNELGISDSDRNVVKKVRVNTRICRFPYELENQSLMKEIFYVFPEYADKLLPFSCLTP